MNNKLYGRLSGRCSIHGANHFGGAGRVGFNQQRCICEVTAECAYARKTKHGKRYMRRQARRKNWETP